MLPRASPGPSPLAMASASPRLSCSTASPASATAYRSHPAYGSQLKNSLPLPAWSLHVPPPGLFLLSSLSLHQSKSLPN